MPLVDAGKMPNLARLIEQGVCGNMATLQPALSPMLWTSIATGKRPYKHGIFGFSEPDPVNGGIRPITNLSRKKRDAGEPIVLSYRVLYMERDMHEILGSQAAMLKRLDRTPGDESRSADIGKVFRQQDRRARDWCRERGLHAMSVSYEGLVHRPDDILPAIAEFLGTPDRLAVPGGKIAPI